MIDYSCPTCGQQHTAPETAAGARHECTSCGQRVQVPRLRKPVRTAAHPSLNKTRLGQVPDQEEVLEVVAARPRKRRRRQQRSQCLREGDCCPYCDGELIARADTSMWGWIVFSALLVLLLFPVCWIGLFIRSRWLVCADCGERIECLNQFWMG